MKEEKIIKLVKGVLADDIVSEILKNLEIYQGQSFQININLELNIGEEIEGKIRKSTVKVAKPLVTSEKASQDIFDAIILKLKQKNDSYGEDYLEIITKIKNNNGQIYFSEEESPDAYNHQRLISGLNSFLLSRGFQHKIRSTGEMRTFALYKIIFD